MRIFQEVPLPPTCYVAEAALWVALGRVPQVLSKASDYGEDYSSADPRTNLSAFEEDDSIIWFDRGFSQAEFKHMGIDVLWDLYAKTKNLLSSNYAHLNKPSGEEVVKAHLLSEWILVELGAKAESSEVQLAMESVRAGVDCGKRIDAQCDAIIDIARAEVFKALAKGTLSALGWEKSAAREAEKSSAKALRKIPTSHWSMRNFDWENSELQHASGGYFAVQVSTSEMLSNFPRPQCEPVVRALDMYPSCILTEEDDASPQLMPAFRAARGRPPKGDGLIRKAVFNVFSDRAARGTLPEKQTALVQEVIDYVALAFEETIVRSTAQEYIKNLPINNAGKSS